jgi:type III restriction enzyme
MEDSVLMIETKSSGMVSDVEVLAKRDAALEWCKHATEYAQQHGGKPWKFIMIPHEAVAENRTLTALASEFEVRSAVGS